MRSDCMIIVRHIEVAYQITTLQYNGKIYVLEFDAPIAGLAYSSWEVE